MKYLGLPLGATFKEKTTGLKKIKGGQLANWKLMYFSKDVRITLIKSTFLNLSPYFMSLFPLTSSVANHTEKLQRDSF